MNVFGADGVGIFPAPTVIATEVMAQYNVETLGRATDVRESFYAISAERKVKHPAVVAISAGARADAELTPKRKRAADARGVTRKERVR